MTESIFLPPSARPLALEYLQKLRADADAHSTPMERGADNGRAAVLAAAIQALLAEAADAAPDDDSAAMVLESTVGALLLHFGIERAESAAQAVETARDLCEAMGKATGVCVLGLARLRGWR